MKGIVQIHVPVSLLLAIIFIAAACTASSRIKDGQTAFDRMQFARAAELLMEEYTEARTVDQQAKKAFLLGESFRRMNKMEQALLWYRQSYELSADPATLFAYADALKRNEQYESASRAYEELQRLTGRDAEYRREITACKQSSIWKAARAMDNFVIKPLDGNTSEAEYAPFILDADHVLFTSDGIFSEGKEIYAWTGNRFSDLMIRNVRTGDLAPWGKPVNTIDNEGAASLSIDRTEMFFTRCSAPDDKDAYCSIYYSKNLGGSWSDPQPMPWSGPDFNDGHPWLAPSGKVLFFSSDRPNGQGGYDIWLSRRLPSGWEAPINLGPVINTTEDEKFPTMDKDTLYYSSDGKIGMGGLDVFKTYLLPDGRWAPPMNMKAPVNSGGDDFGFVVDRFTTPKDPVVFSGYLSSSRKGGAGSDDLFRFQYRKLPPELKEEKRRSSLFLVVNVLEPVYQKAGDPNSGIKGYEPIPSARLGLTPFGGTAVFLSTDENGRVIREVPWSVNIRLNAEKRGYLSTELDLDQVVPSGMDKDSTISVDMVLLPVIKGVEFVLRDIYYDFDKWDIREDAKPSLDKLATILINNPDIRIELSAHTDCRGEDLYNLELSQRRAQAAVDYLISQGIQSDRMVARGYGERVPFVQCLCEQCSEEQHQLNRRTSFKILE